MPGRISRCGGVPAQAEVAHVGAEFDGACEPEAFLDGVEVGSSLRYAGRSCLSISELNRVIFLLAVSEHFPANAGGIRGTLDVLVAALGTEDAEHSCCSLSISVTAL